MDEEQKKVYEAIKAALKRARAVAEEAGSVGLGVGACLDIIYTAFRYDLCKEAMEVLVNYGRMKIAQTQAAKGNKGKLRRPVFIVMPESKTTH